MSATEAFSLACKATQTNFRNIGYSLLVDNAGLDARDIPAYTALVVFVKTQVGNQTINLPSLSLYKGNNEAIMIILSIQNGGPENGVISIQPTATNSINVLAPGDPFDLDGDPIDSKNIFIFGLPYTNAWIISN